MSKPSEHQVNEALKSYGLSLESRRAVSKFNTFWKMSDEDFDQAIKWTVASIRNDAEYEERVRDHGCGCV